MENIEKSDFDEIFNTKKKKLNSSGSKLGGFCKYVSFKLIILLFIIYILIHNDVFINKVLSNISGTVDENIRPCTTTKGTIILGILTIISMIVLDFLINVGII